MRRTAVLVAGGLIAAVGLRIWVLTSPLGGLDADEAVWGLMARHVLDGELPVFFWSQSYGGTQEVLLTAAVFGVTGTSVAALRAVPLLLFAGACVLVWRVGLRTIEEPGARIAAALVAVWPAYLVWKSTRAHGFYGAALVLCLLVLLLVLRLSERDSHVDAALLGLALGLGWWATPQTSFVAVPALLWLAWRLRARLARLWPVIPALLAGAAPWLWWNVEHGWDSLHTPFERGADTYVDHLRTFFYATFPSILGLRVPFSLEWLTGEAIGRTLEVLAFAAVVGLALLRGGNRSLLATVTFLYPLLQSVSPFSVLNEEPRYLVLLVPVLALVVADVVATRPSLAAVAMIALVALSIVGLHRMGEQRPAVPPVGYQRVPADLGPVLRMLERTGHRRVRAHYAIAYRITFESRERIIAASTGQVRRRAYQELVDRTPHPAWVFVRGSADERRRRTRLQREGYRRVAAGDWAVYVYRAAER